MKSQKPIIICGPTASGKTALALQLAQELSKRNRGRRDPVIINADSQQVYKEIPIISAQPTHEEKKLARHYLFGEIPGNQDFNVAIWLDGVKSKIKDQESKTIIIVGGSGMYINALLHGLSPIPDIAPEIRTRVRLMDKAELSNQLGSHADGNTSRMRRNLEVKLATGKFIHEFHEVALSVNCHRAEDFTILNMDVSRETIYANIDRRFVAMVENGALDEVRNLLKLDYSPALPVMKAVGVAEIKSYLEGKISLTEAIAKASQRSRNYAKRQMTWFRHQLPAHKIDVASFAGTASLFT